MKTFFKACFANTKFCFVFLRFNVTVAKKSGRKVENMFVPDAIMQRPQQMVVKTYVLTLAVGGYSLSAEIKYKCFKVISNKQLYCTYFHSQCSITEDAIHETKLPSSKCIS